MVDLCFCAQPERAGFVYAVCGAQLSCVKVGRTQKPDAEAYLADRYRYPVEHQLLQLHRTSDCWLAEKLLHSMLAISGSRSSTGREMFHFRSTEEAALHVKLAFYHASIFEAARGGLPALSVPIEMGQPYHDSEIFQVVQTVEQAANSAYSQADAKLRAAKERAERQLRKAEDEAERTRKKAKRRARRMEKAQKQADKKAKKQHAKAQEEQKAQEKADKQAAKAEEEQKQHQEQNAEHAAVNS